MSNLKTLRWVKAIALLFALSVTGCGGSSSNGSSSSILPQVVAVTPNTAPSLSATTVTITGKNFSSTTPVQVVFGKDVATSVAVVSDTQIVAVAPAKTAGGDVRVTTATGTSPQTINDVFANYPVPI